MRKWGRLGGEADGSMPLRRWPNDDEAATKRANPFGYAIKKSHSLRVVFLMLQTLGFEPMRKWGRLGGEADGSMPLRRWPNDDEAATKRANPFGYAIKKSHSLRVVFLMLQALRFEAMGE